MMPATWLALLTLSKKIYTLLIGPHALQICGGCHVTDRDLIPNVQYLLLRGKYSTTVHTYKQKYSTTSIYLPQISLKSTKTCETQKHSCFLTWPALIFKTNISTILFDWIWSKLTSPLITLQIWERTMGILELFPHCNEWIIHEPNICMTFIMIHSWY